MRAFVALDLDPHVQDALDAAVAAASGWSPAFRAVARANRHLTLAFLGDIAAAAPVIAALRAVRHPPFELRLQGLGRFPPKRDARVLWAGVGGDVALLESLARAVSASAQGAGAARDRMPFRPHITLARARRHGGAAADPSLAVALEPASWSVRHFTLYQSTLARSGPRYDRLATFPLDEPPRGHA